MRYRQYAQIPPNRRIHLPVRKHFLFRYISPEAFKNKPRHEISINVAFLTSVDSDKPGQPPFNFRDGQ